MPEPTLFRDLTRQYFVPGPVVTASRWNQFRWALTIPFRSLAGGRMIRRHVAGPAPAAWAEEMAGKRVLVVGSGPSLDRVDDAFFDRFDVVIYINFAIRRRREVVPEYFFTTDIGPTREFLDAYDDAVFHALGPAHCIFAPVFLDQFQMMTPRGRALFTWLAFDKGALRVQWAKAGPLRLPVILRYHPRQPDWDTFRLPHGGRHLPVVDHTSALSAILFAAMNGAHSVGMIGCDFSAGRAASVASLQALPDKAIFSGAAGELRRLQAALARQGVEVVNHSWEV
ncbi:MAG: hypothetical protein RIS94_766 [Pseudomonadota bacterium]